MQERRRAERISIHCKIFGTDDEFIGYALDVSLYGVKLMIRTPVEIKDNLKFKIEWSDKKNVYYVNATIRIIWQRLHSREYKLLGGEFTDIENKTSLVNLLDYGKRIQERYND